MIHVTTEPRTDAQIVAKAREMDVYLRVNSIKGVVMLVCILAMFFALGAWLF